MDDIFDCWVDERGRVITASSLDAATNAQTDPVFENGFAHMTWNEGGVTVSYSKERIQTGALRGVMRQIRQIKRPVEIKRHTGSDWNRHSAPSGSAAVDILKEDEGRPA